MILGTTPDRISYRFKISFALVKPTVPKVTGG